MLLELGDVVTFGRHGDQHAAMVLKPGEDPLLWSFGHQGAPDSYRLSEDGRECQLLKLPAAPYQPSTADKLRAETGYWAWVQRRLGEADWAGYGKTNAEVRPSVPRVIPAGWWVALTRFLLARRKSQPS